MHIILHLAVLMFVGSSPSMAQSNTCSLEYRASARICSQEKSRMDVIYTYDSVMKVYNKCLDTAIAAQSCCNMEEVLKTKNSGSDKSHYIVKDGFACTEIRSRNTKPECVACENSCKTRMKEVGGMPSSCKSLCANNDRLNCKG